MLNLLKPTSQEDSLPPERVVLHKSDITSGFITERMVKDVVIRVGNIADRPTNGSTHTKAYWAEDESKLYLWNSVNEAWESTTLS